MGVIIPFQKSKTDPPFNLRGLGGQSEKSPVFRPVSLTRRVNGSYDVVVTG